MEEVKATYERVKVLGGHPGMLVERVKSKATGNVVVMKALDGSGVNVEGNQRAIANECKMLDHLITCGFVPRVTAIESIGTDRFNWAIHEDLGPCEPITDSELFRQNCVRMLATFRARGVRHGDLTGPQAGGESNIIVKDNRPYAVDWQESHYIGDEAPQKSPYSDSWLLMRSIANWPTADGKTLDTPRVARRWMAVLEALGAHTDLSLPLKGKTFVDFGCYQGDFVALAAAEGMRAIGVDRGTFTSDRNSLDVAWELWGELPFGETAWLKNDIRGYFETGLKFHVDVGMMFSTWPYIVKDHGVEIALELLKMAINSCDVFFFETQLFADGPGPEFLKSDADVGDMLRRMVTDRTIFGRATFSVEGRNARRTVWEIR